MSGETDAEMEEVVKDCPRQILREVWAVPMAKTLPRRAARNRVHRHQREALRSFLEKRSEEQTKVLSRLIFHFYNDVKRKCEWKMESAAYWVEELGRDGLLS